MNESIIRKAVRNYLEMNSHLIDGILSSMDWDWFESYFCDTMDEEEFERVRAVLFPLDFDLVADVAEDLDMEDNYLEELGTWEDPNFEFPIHSSATYPLTVEDSWFYGHPEASPFGGTHIVIVTERECNCDHREPTAEELVKEFESKYNIV